MVSTADNESRGPTTVALPLGNTIWTKFLWGAEPSQWSVHLCMQIEICCPDHGYLHVQLAIWEQTPYNNFDTKPSPDTG